MDRFLPFKLTTFKLFDNILTYPKCGTKYLNNTFGKNFNDDIINFYELFNYEIKYIIIRDPVSYFISAVNESLRYEEPLKKILESFITGINSDWSPNNYKLIELYVLLNPNKTIVLLENLTDFLKHEIKIEPVVFSDHHKTQKLYDMETLQNEEPYLISLILKILELEKISYQYILTENKVYKRKESLI
jgi:hypothetical protein